MTLIGVTPAGSSEIKLNPGIEHTMHEDDICYYIGFTREEFSRVGGVQSIHHSLQQACATLAAYTMSSVGINPNELDEKNELEAKGLSTNGSSTPTFPSRKVSTNSMLTQQQSGGFNTPDIGSVDVNPEEGQVRFYIPHQDTISVDSVSISLQPHIQVSSPGGTPGGGSLQRDHGRSSVVSQHVSEAKRGLQLFRFHSGLNVHANPVVKLRCHSLENCPAATPVAASPTHVEQPLQHYHGSYVLDSHHLLPRLSEASEEREGSPYSEDADNDRHGDEFDEAPPTYSQSQNDVFPSVEELTPRQLEDGRQREAMKSLHRPRGPHLKPLKLEREALTETRPHPHSKKSDHHHQLQFHHRHRHGAFLKPHPPAYHRSLSEDILTSSKPQPHPPTPHKKGSGSPLYSSTLSLIVPEDEVKGESKGKLPKSLSHEELSPREIPHHPSSNAHHFLEFLRHPSMWSASSHSHHDLPSHGHPHHGHPHHGHPHHEV